MMIFKVILLTALLASIHTDESFESFDRSVDCDSFYSGVRDMSLISSIIRNELQFDYDRRNDNFDSFLHFMAKLNSF